MSGAPALLTTEKYRSPLRGAIRTRRPCMIAEDVATQIRFERASAHIGAYVHGISLEQPATPALREALRGALHENGVLFFEFGQTVTSEQQARFTGLFGKLEIYGFSTSEEKPSEENNAAGCIDAAKQPLRQYRTNMWHTDGTPFECPPEAAILTCLEAPELGGGTMWSSMYAAYDALSTHYQRMLDGLQVLHSTMRTPFVKQYAETVHPAVIRDPVTGRKALFVNSVYSERFLDMSEQESDSLMRFLFEHVNMPEFHVALRWKQGTVAVWEERVTQHRAVDAFVGPRKLRRLTTKGEKPTA
ncbi:MAG: TauD/TfdA family dioxygenase [Sphingobium sp.]